MILKIPTLTTLLALAALLFGTPLQAGIADPIRAAQDYSRDVPQGHRELVPPGQYQWLVDTLASAVEASGGQLPVDVATIHRVAASPCGPSLGYLIREYAYRPEVRQGMDRIAAGLVDPPAGYGFPNPWRSANGARLLGRMVGDFLDWCTFLPEANGSHDNGLAYIQHFAWFFYHNPAGHYFVQGRNPLDPTRPLETGWRFTKEFTEQRGAYMWSPASRRYISQWIDDPRIEIGQYRKTEPGQYASWNEFFARQLKPDQRPVTMPEADYVVVSPTDCIMNPLVQVLDVDGAPRRRLVENPLQFDTVLDVKGIPISLRRLLAGVDPAIAGNFVGGTGLSCVLMPNTYHHFHAPVDGTVVHAQVLKGNTYGYFDWPNWVPLDHNVGRPGTDFSQFELFQRGVVIIEVSYAGLDGKPITGYVASIPVGLDTIGSVVLREEVKPGLKVKKGVTELGNFYYGGSLDILLFSKGLADGAVQTRMGNQITILKVGESPASPVN